MSLNPKICGQSPVNLPGCDEDSCESLIAEAKTELRNEFAESQAEQNSMLRGELDQSQAAQNTVLRGEISGTASALEELFANSQTAQTSLLRGEIAAAKQEAINAPKSYSLITEKPKLNGVTIDGDKTSGDYGIDSVDSEAWAVGTKNGIPVSSSEEQYHNNSKYYAESLNERTSEILDSIQSQIEDWFEELQETLQVSAHIREFKKTVSGTVAGVSSIPLDMTDYSYHPSDVIDVSVNGLVLTPQEYSIISGQEYMQVQLVDVGPLYEGDTAMVRVLKANIGDTIDIQPMRGVAF